MNWLGSISRTFTTGMGVVQALLLTGVCAGTVAAQGTPDTIADSTFAPGDWNTSVVTEFGASEFHEQRLTGGHPGAFRYMEHILPSPPGPNDLARVEVTHIYEGDPYLVVIDAIERIDYGEDVRLLTLPWDQAFIVSYPVVRQSGRVFIASDYLSVVADTFWHSFTIPNLGAGDFTAMDESGDHPDFSSGGDFLYFGFWRVSIRSGLLPPIPAQQDLVYVHGSDNFTVFIHKTPADNLPPVARADNYMYLDYFFNAPQALPVLQNDSDVDGDPIRVFSVDSPAFGGTIVSFSDATITYAVVDPLLLGIESDFFTYTITDEQEESSPAFVTMHFCTCPIECIFLFLTPARPAVPAAVSGDAAPDTLDVDLFRQFRDEVMLQSTTGSAFVDLYYRHAAEVMPLLVFDRPDIGGQALRTLTAMQSPVQNLLQGDGTAPVAQTLVDSVSAFLDSLTTAVSDSLRDTLNALLTLLGPLQNLADLTVAAAVDTALGISVPASVEDGAPTVPADFELEPNYPNPFNPSTRISFFLAQPAAVELAIYNVLGKRVRSLTSGPQPAGRTSVVWDGRDDAGAPVASGLYLVRMHTADFQASRKMILMR